MIGEDQIAEVAPNSSYINLSLNIIIHDESYQKLIDFIYSALQIYAHDPTYIVEKTKTYYSANVLDQTLAIYNLAYKDIYSTKYLNSLMLSKLPPYALMLKVESSIILLYNINASEDL
ncbi:24711_t:CDS:2, partial [Cetraspora pellucida]